MYSTAMRDIQVTRLNDDFGQYVILLSCACGHIRECTPHTLAAFAGWDALLADVVRRMRCSKCHQKRCTARTMQLPTPRGYKRH